MKISIYAAYHKESAMPKSNEIHIPIHVGKALSSQKIDGTIGDNTGDNISHLNPLFCETTATYWAWKNDKISDYIGICHYRRFFSFSKVSFLKRVANSFRFMNRKLRRPSEVHFLINQIKCESVESFQNQLLKFEKELQKKTVSNSIEFT